MITRRIELSRSPTHVRLGNPIAATRAGEVHAGVGPTENLTGTTAVEQPESGLQGAGEQKHQLDEAVDAIFEAVADLEVRRQQSIDELRELAVELACAITSHVLADMSEKQELPLEKMIDQALAHLSISTPQDITVRLHPDDYHAIAEQWNRKVKENETPYQPVLAPDASLNRGSCEATAEGRGITVDIADQLNQIRHELLRTLNDAKAERRDPERNNQQVQRYPNRRNTA